MDEARATALERKVRRLQRLVAVLILGFAFLVVWRLLPGPQVLSARQFLMRDQHGAVRGALLMLADGRPTLRLNDKNGKARAMLYLNRESGGALRFVDLEGQQRAVLQLSASGTPDLHLNDASGRFRTLIRPGTGVEPAIVIRDEALTRIWTNPTRQTGSQ